MARAERTYQSPLGFSYTDRDVEKLAEAALGEARSQGNVGMQAVMNNIVNRTIDGNFGKGISKVVGTQYSYTTDHNLGDARSILASNSKLASTARSMALQAVQGQLADVTGGSTGYHNPETAKLSKWQRDGLASGTAKVIGDHVFYNSDPNSQARIQAAYTMGGAPAPVQEASMWDRAMQAPVNAVNSIESLLGFGGVPAAAEPAPGPDVGEMMAGPELAAAQAKPSFTPGRPVTNEATLDPLNDVQNITNSLASSSPQLQARPEALGTNASLLSSLGLAGQPVPAPGRVINMGLAPPAAPLPPAAPSPESSLIDSVINNAPGAKPTVTPGKPVEGNVLSGASSLISSVLGTAPGASPTARATASNVMADTPEGRQISTGMSDETRIAADVGGVPSLGTLSPGYKGPDDYGAQQVMAASVTPSPGMAQQAPDLTGEFGGTAFGDFSAAPYAAPSAPSAPTPPSLASVSTPSVVAPAKFQERAATPVLAPTPTTTVMAPQAPQAPAIATPPARPAPMAAAVDNPLASITGADPTLGVPSLADPSALSSLAGITSGYATTPEEEAAAQPAPQAQQPAPVTPQVTPRPAPPPTTVEQAPVEAAQPRPQPEAAPGPEKTYGPLPQDQAVVGSGVFDEGGNLVGRIDKEGKATALPGIGTAIKDIGRGALKGSVLGPAGSLLGALFGGISSQANIFGGPESKATFEATPQSDVIGANGKPGGSTANGLHAAVNALNLGKAPEGYSFGWSPFGNGVALVSHHAPESIQIAGSGSGIFGALGLAPSNKAQPPGADKGTGIGGFFHNLFGGGGGGQTPGAGGLSGPTVTGTAGLY